MPGTWSALKSEEFGLWRTQTHGFISFVPTN